MQALGRVTFGDSSARTHRAGMDPCRQTRAPEEARLIPYSGLRECRGGETRSGIVTAGDACYGAFMSPFETRRRRSGRYSSLSTSLWRSGSSKCWFLYSIVLLPPWYYDVLDSHWPLSERLSGFENGSTTLKASLQFPDSHNLQCPTKKHRVTLSSPFFKVRI